MPKQENETRYNVSYADESGELKTLSNLTEKALEKFKKESQDKEFEITKQQTFVITEAESIDDAQKLVKPEVALQFLNRGFRLAQQNEAKSFMDDEDEAQQEGIVDLLALVGEPRTRRSASPRDKAINTMLKIARDSGNTGVTREDIEKVLASLMPQEAGATA